MPGLYGEKGKVFISTRVAFLICYLNLLGLLGINGKNGKQGRPGVKTNINIWNHLIKSKTNINTIFIGK